MPPRNKTRLLSPGLQSKSTSALPILPSTDGASSPALLDATPPTPSAAGDGQHDDQELLLSDDSGSDSDDEDPAPPTSRPLYTSRSHTHLTPHGGAFFPPFYNRPPTPLPPSPSLTSLLRPSFSSASRASTPDSSDVDIQARPPPRRRTSRASPNRRRTRQRCRALRPKCPRTSIMASHCTWRVRRPSCST